MAWKAVHPGLTEKLRIPDEDGAPTFELGFWPPLEAEKMKVVRERINRSAANVDPVKDFDRMLAESGIGLESYRSMCRLGVRGWTGFGDFEPQTEEVVVDGRRHVALKDDSLHLLYVNHLLVAVGLKCFLFNILTEDAKGNLDWRYGSSTTSRSIDAAGAAPATHQETTETSPTG